MSAAEQAEPGERPALQPAAEPSAPVADRAAGFTDTLTLTFADEHATSGGLFVFERESGASGSGAATGRAGALLFADGRLLASHAAELAPAEPRWEALGSAALGIEIAGAAWRVTLRAEGISTELEFEPRAPAFAHEPLAATAATSGLRRVERGCKVAGSVALGGETRTLQGAGVRAHQWGPSPRGQIASWRALGAWLDGELDLAAWTARPARAGGHEGDTISARVFWHEPPLALAVEEPRVSVTTGADGEPLRAGLELWLAADDEFPRRAAGERICSGTLGIAGSRHRFALLRWHMERREGPGALQIVEPA